MFTTENFNKGFTLIELMVVISIIGLLASVISASLSSARAKGKDGALKQQAIQMRNMLELEYTDTGSYLGLQPIPAQQTWVTTTADCAGIVLSGNYASKTRDICSNIVRTGASVTWTSGKFYLGTQSGLSSRYSLMIALPGKNTFFCMGSSGQSSDTDSGTWLTPGCWSNP